MKSRNNLTKGLSQFLIYLVVGAGATVVEWLVFYLLNQRGTIDWGLATAIAFIFSTFANWLFGKILLFRDGDGILKELAKIYLTSIAGLVMNLLIMWVAVDHLMINEMIAKMMATGIVFIWNFGVRKFLIYKV